MSTISQITSALRKQEAADRAPTDPRVSDLEKRLTEATARLEKIERGYAKPDAELFKGAFIKNAAALRAHFRGVAVGDTRNISSTTISTAGKLTAEQTNRFISFLVEKQTALSRVTTWRMSGPTANTEVLRIASRKIRGGVEATTPTISDAETFNRRTLTTKEVIWAEDLTGWFLDDNAESHDIEATIARRLATAFGNDLNDLAWNGDDSLTSTAAFHVINKGWFKLASADSDVTKLDFATTASGGPFTGASTATDALKLVWKNMPAEFKGRPDFIFWVSVPFAEAYANEVSRRETDYGDVTLINGLPNLRYFGIPVVPEPHFTGTTTPDLSGDKIMLTPAANLYHGIQRSITVDSMWQPRKRVLEFTVFARNDYEYADGKAIVTAKGLPAQLR